MSNIRGRKAKLSKDPGEQRSYLWRHTGKLHNDLNAHCKNKGISVNRFLTRLVEKEIYNLPDPPKRPFVSDETDEDVQI